MSESLPASIFTRIVPYLRLVRLDRPVGTFLLLWPTLWALWLAGNGSPDPDIVLIFIAGTFVMRSAGCAINDYADRHVDGSVARTSARPIPAGEISPHSALLVFALLLIAAFGLVLLLNRQTILLSFGGALIAALYPFAKRVTNLPQLVLGLAFSWGIPMSYSALTGAVPLQGWILFGANFAWIVAYDTQYAMADREDDLVIGVKSTAILFGRFDNLIIGSLQLLTLAILAAIGNSAGLGPHFYLGLALAATFALYQQWLCAARDRDRCFRAFLNNVWFGAMVFGGIILGQLSGSS